MIVTRSLKDQSWIDISSPTKEELNALSIAGGVSPLLTKDLLTPTPKQHVTVFGNSIYIVLRIPVFNHNKLVASEQEVDFIITPNSVITGRYDSIDALHHFAKQIEVDEILHKGASSHLFFGLIREVYNFLFDELAYFEDWVKVIEKSIFEGQEKEMVWSISAAERNLLNFKRVLSPHRGVWQDVLESCENDFSPEFKKDLRGVVNEWERLVVSISDLSEMIDELRDTNNALLSTKQNEIMKLFTIMAFVTFPLSLVASIFGMNTAHMPIIGNLHDFWIVMSIMVLMSLAMFAYFKYKRWI